MRDASDDCGTMVAACVDALAAWDRNQIMWSALYFDRWMFRPSPGHPRAWPAHFPTRAFESPVFRTSDADFLAVPVTRAVAVIASSRPAGSAPPVIALPPSLNQN